MKREVEFRIKRDMPVGGSVDKEWSEIEPITLTLEDGAIESIVSSLMNPTVIEVRWNYGGYVAGIGQGHYTPGPAHPFYDYCN